MKPTPRLVILALAALCAAGDPFTPAAGAADAPANDDYPPGPDSVHQSGVPQGKTFTFTLNHSTIFPETTRTITVYVPAQYDGQKPACVYVGLDGLGFNAPVVFDNLIARKEMPVTIGIGVSPGQVNPAQEPPAAQAPPDGKAKAKPKPDPRFNRSYEFDGMNDHLARFVVEEVFAEVSRHKTPDGLAIRLSDDPNDRCTGGGSTGGIGAFTLAWQRPDQFRRVFTAIGTFVGMRGGDAYPVLVRKTEPKPLRVFMQDGSNDEWMGGPEVGDWWMGNQTLQRALEFSGYQVQHVWGTGPHSGKHGTAVFPDAMRYLWKDWPKPVTAGESQNTFLKAILQPGEGWGQVTKHGAASAPIAADAHGEVQYIGGSSGRIAHLSDDPSGWKYPVTSPVFAIASFAFGPDGKVVTAGDTGGVSVVMPVKDGLKSPAKNLATDSKPGHLFVTHSGLVYGTEPQPKGPAGEPRGRLWLFTPSGQNGEKKLLDQSLDDPAGVAVSPDGLWLAVLERATHRGYSYRVHADGTVDARQAFYWLHVPDDADDSGAGQICFDAAGRLYAATRMGVQVLDRNGRTRAILPVPALSDGRFAPVTGVCCGGEKFDTLYVTAGGNVYRRKMKAAGLAPGAAPIELPAWGAG